MPTEIKCPECGSLNIKELLYKAAVGSSVNGKYPGEAKYHKYECLDCGLEFDEGDLREYSSN